MSRNRRGTQPVKHHKIRTTDRLVLFSGGWPSQWYECRFEVYGMKFNCAEQFMMAEKAKVFGDYASLQAILKAAYPRAQKAIGRRVVGFDETVWQSVCRGIVYSGNLAKFEQNADLRERLLATGDRIIAEASPTDTIWGIGLTNGDPRAKDPAQWRGKNWLGIALMQVRDELRRRRRLPAPPFDEELRRQIDERAALTGKV